MHERSKVAKRIEQNYRSVYARETSAQPEWVMNLRQKFNAFEHWKTAQQQRVAEITKRINELDTQIIDLQEELKASIARDTTLATIRHKLTSQSRKRRNEDEAEYIQSLWGIHKNVQLGSVL